MVIRYSAEAPSERRRTFSRGVTDLNTILALPGQQGTVVRMNTALRNSRPFLVSILKERRALSMELETAADGVRVLQQPLSLSFCGFCAPVICCLRKESTSSEPM